MGWPPPSRLPRPACPSLCTKRRQFPGGGARTLELTLPGFRHDFGSAVHPMAAGSPFFRKLPLAAHGLEWIHSPAALAHPLDDGTAVLLMRDLDEQCRLLGDDGAAWRRILEPLSRGWWALAEDILQPLSPLPRHPLLLARMGACGALPASVLARRSFQGERARALFAGMAAHSFLGLDQPFSASFGLVMAATAHAVGWPIPRGGSQAITRCVDRASAVARRVGADRPRLSNGWRM